MQVRGDIYTVGQFVDIPRGPFANYRGVVLRVAQDGVEMQLTQRLPVSHFFRCYNGTRYERRVFVTWRDLLKKVP